MSNTHGGSRKNAGRKSKLQDTALQRDWQSYLKRTIILASENFGVLKPELALTLRELTGIYGKRAAAEYRTWFESQRMFNKDESDRLYKDFVRGGLTEAQYNKFLYTKAYTWCWSLRSERQRDAWMIARCLKEMPNPS